MKKTAYIHIGLPKTGTTAIQTTLQRFFDEGKLDRFDMQFHGPENTYELAMDFWCTGDMKYFIEQIHKQILSVSRIGEKNVIFSNEALLGRIRDYKDWRFRSDLLPVLAEAFKDYDTKVIVYIRRQDLFMESMANQRAKTGSNTSSNNTYLYYKCLLDRCVECFNGRVIVRKYERESLYKNDVVTDFLHAINMDELIDDYLENKGKNKNPSLSSRAALISMVNNRQYQLNEAEAKQKIEELENQYKDGLLSRKVYVNLVWGNLAGGRDVSKLPGKSIDIQKKLLLENSDTSFLGSSYGFFSPEERAEIMAKYEEDNAAVAREYFGQEDGKLFNDKVPKNIIDMNSEPSATDIVQTFMPIIVNLTERCERLEMSPLRRFLEKNKPKIRKRLDGFPKLFEFLRKIYRRTK